MKVLRWMPLLSTLAVCCLVAASAGYAQSGMRISSAGRFARGISTSVAIRGYSPVSLVRRRQWVKGNNDYRVEFDGRAYLLATEREMQMFRASPESYVPALGGDCVVDFVNSGRRTEGVLRHGVIHNDRLYFFSSSEHKQAFVDNPSRYASTDVALHGICPVSLVELNRAIPGQPELAAVVSGFRYIFPGAQEREMFLAQPYKYASAAHAIAANMGIGTAASTAVSAAAGPDGFAAIDGSGSGTAGASRGRGQIGGNEGQSAGVKDGVPLALSGYSPVAIKEESRWVRGKQEYGVVYQGHRYLFAGADEKQIFQDNPEGYAPVLGGDCVVCLRDRGERVEGDVFHAVFHRGRLYLFPNAEQKEAFKKDPDLYAQAAEAVAEGSSSQRSAVGS